MATQEKIVLPHSFESTTNADDIFIFCLSTKLSAELAKQFKVNACVEITNRTKFIAGIRSALRRRPSIKSKVLIHDKVKYYGADEPPVVDWALPERIAMSKLDCYSSQEEYRLAFSENGAFEVENTQICLTPPGEHKAPRATAYPERLLKIGKLTKSCKVYRFD